MGTSTSNPGPAGRNPLLPPWATDAVAVTSADSAGDDSANDSSNTDSGSDEGPLGLPESELRPSLPLPRPWRAAKVSMRRLASSGARNDSHIRSTGRHFVNALGGSRRAAASSVASRRTAGRLGGFLAGVARDGLTPTLERLGLTQYVGQGLSTLLVALANLLAPSSATTDDAVAAVAYHETMADLAEDLALDADGIAGFEKLDDAMVRSVMERYVANVVITRLLQVLAGQIDRGAVSPERAVATEFEIKDFVQGSVALEFGMQDLTTLDWASPKTVSFIEELFRQGYGIFGGSA